MSFSLTVDLPRLCFLERFLVTFRANTPPYPNSEKLHDRKGRTLWLYRDREDACESFKVYFKGERVASALVEWGSQERVDLSDIRVDECYRSQGIGEVLLEEIKRVAEVQEVRVIWAMMNQKVSEQEMLRLVRWYQRNGFTIHGMVAIYQLREAKSPERGETGFLK
jgi:ribosomal protein S18 acetylase RimI-like enzyme